MPPFSHLTSCTPTKSNLYLANYLAVAVNELELYRFRTFHVPNHMSLFHCVGRTGQLKCDGTSQKPYFVFRRKGRGRQFSRLLAAEVCASAVVILNTPCSEVVWRVLATHSIRQSPLHFPSRTSPCAIIFQLESTKGPVQARSTCFCCVTRPVFKVRIC